MDANWIRGDPFGQSDYFIYLFIFSSIFPVCFAIAVGTFLNLIAASGNHLLLCGAGAFEQQNKKKRKEETIMKLIVLLIKQQ